MLYIGVALLLLAGILLLIRRSQQSKLRDLRAAQPTSVREVTALARSVARDLQSLGQDTAGFRQIAAISGEVQSDEPLTSEVAHEPCVYYVTSVEREYEETYRETNSQTGQEVEKTRRGSETVSSHAQRAPFWVADPTGRLLVDPEGADVDSVSVADRFESAEAAGGSISIGGLTLNLGGLAPSHGRRTLGYHFRESALPLGRRVYVLGEVVDDAGQLKMQKPAGGHGRFIISLKSGEELVRSTASTVQWLLYGAAASGAAGFVLIVFGLLRR